LFNGDKQREANMKKFLSVLAVATIAAGLTVSVADAKPRKSASKMMSSNKAGGANNANSMSGKNSPSSNAKGSASSAGGGEK
jgi:hypothetical protein